MTTTNAVPAATTMPVAAAATPIIHLISRASRAARPARTSARRVSEVSERKRVEHAADQSIPNRPCCR